ncbi:hypothetical protein ACYATO_07985 [Lactobacillaceae bacterium Melli_B3]
MLTNLDQAAKYASQASDSTSEASAANVDTSNAASQANSASAANPHNKVVSSAASVANSASVVAN